MARLLFEISGVRRRNGQLATGAVYAVYSNEAGTTLADISATVGGSAISGSTVTVADITGLGPSALRFYGPSAGTDTLWLKSTTDASLGVQKIEADPDERLDALETAVGGTANVARRDQTNTFTEDQTIQADNRLRFGTQGSLFSPASGYVATEDIFQSKRANATDVAYQAYLAGAGASFLEILTSGKLQWGDGTNPADTTLYREAAGYVASNGAFQSRRANLTDLVFAPYKSGDASGRYEIYADGKTRWGNGGGGFDVTLERTGIAELETNAAFRSTVQRSRFGNGTGDFLPLPADYGLLVHSVTSDPNTTIMQHLVGASLYIGTPGGSCGTLQGGSCEAQMYNTTGGTVTPSILGFEGLGFGSGESGDCAQIIGLQGSAIMRGPTQGAGLLISINASAPHRADGTGTITEARSLNVQAPADATTMYSVYVDGRVRAKYNAGTGTNVLELADASSNVQMAVDGATGRLRFIAGNQATTVGAAGGASALPATPTGYFIMYDSGGTARKVPYYAT